MESQVKEIRAGDWEGVMMMAQMNCVGKMMEREILTENKWDPKLAGEAENAAELADKGPRSAVTFVKLVVGA
jgi:hypothetical protein